MVYTQLAKSFLAHQINAIRPVFLDCIALQLLRSSGT